MSDVFKEIIGAESVVPIMQVKNLKKYFTVPGKGELHAVDDVSFDIRQNETLGLVGESGCGKSTIGNLVVKLHEATSGKILFHGDDIVTANVKKMERIREKVQLIFQDPFSSINPRKTVRAILSAPLQIHKYGTRSEIQMRVLELMDMVGLEHYILDKFPHELDGGKRQMVGIARALAMNPELIVCDEPVSSLDVSVQATIINLLIKLQKEQNLTYLFISHDLSVVRHISNRVAVMYLGQIVELADTDTIFENALHPYTIALLSAVPSVDLDESKQRIVLRGDVPSPVNPKPGCRFAPRCWMACEDCTKKSPELVEVEKDHFVACPYYLHNRKAKAASEASV